MITAKQKLLDAKQEVAEKKKLAKIIREWTAKNKKLFWKYEVSSFYKTYTIRISRLPEPSAGDIVVSPFIRLLNDQQKQQLCDAVIKSNIKAEALGDSCIDAQIDYVDGAVVADVFS